MKKIKTGNKVLVPFEVLDVQDSGDYPYYLGYGTSRIHASAEMLERFRQVAGGEKDSGKTYEDGLREAWELARKLMCYESAGGFSSSQLEEIFGTCDCDDIVTCNTAQEAAAKIAEWEARNMRAGEIVTDQEERMAIVIQGCIGRDSSKCIVMYGSFEREEKEKDALTRTGRTIDIAGLLAQIGGTEDARDII